MHGWEDMPVINTNFFLRQYWNTLSLNDVYHSYEHRIQCNQSIYSLECWNKIQKENLNSQTVKTHKIKTCLYDSHSSQDRLILLVCHPLLQIQLYVISPSLIENPLSLCWGNMNKLHIHQKTISESNTFNRIITYGEYWLKIKGVP